MLRKMVEQRRVQDLQFVRVSNSAVSAVAR